MKLVMPLQLLNAVLGNVVNLSTIKKTMMLLRTLRMFKLMRKFRVRGLNHAATRDACGPVCVEWHNAAARQSRDSPANPNQNRWGGCAVAAAQQPSCA